MAKKNVNDKNGQHIHKSEKFCQLKDEKNVLNLISCCKIVKMIGSDFNDKSKILNNSCNTFYMWLLTLKNSI